MAPYGASTTQGIPPSLTATTLSFSQAEAQHPEASPGLAAAQFSDTMRYQHPIPPRKHAQRGRLENRDLAWRSCLFHGFYIQRHHKPQFSSRWLHPAPVPQQTTELLPNATLSGTYCAQTHRALAGALRLVKRSDCGPRAIPKLGSL